MTDTTMNRVSLHIGHSPDPDDAFMWYPLANFPDGSGPGGKTYTPTIDTGPYDFIHVLEDIQSLNDRCEKAELEITALSIHHLSFIQSNGALSESYDNFMLEAYLRVQIRNLMSSRKNPLKKC